MRLCWRAFAKIESGCGAVFGVPDNQEATSAETARGGVDRTYGQGCRDGCVDGTPSFTQNLGADSGGLRVLRGDDAG